MNDISEQYSPIKPEDYLMAALIDFYRYPKSAGNFLHAAKLALSILARNSSYSAAKLEKRFIFFANDLKDDINITALRNFAKKCHVAASKIGACTQDVDDKTLSSRSLNKYAKEDLAASLKLGHSEGAAINRAAYQLVRKQREGMQHARMQQKIRSHPLKETLEGLMVKEGRMAKEDIRNKFLSLQRPSAHSRNSGEGVLFGLLAKAQAFSASRVHRLLGDELFFLCRPTGFLDQKGQTVVVEVPTSAHLHALTYRKLEILKALKADEAFSLINKVHLKIKT